MLWINYEDTKPPEDETVLWCNGDGDYWIGHLGGFPGPYEPKPTYWSHLPPLPLAIQKFLKEK